MANRPAMATAREAPAALVAVASRDGKFVHQHFGRAEGFLIFEVHRAGADYEPQQTHGEGEGPLPRAHDGPRFVEVRATPPACGAEGHDDSSLQAVVDLLHDCAAVVAARIGPGVLAALVDAGIRPFELPEPIPDALTKVALALGRRRAPLRERLAERYPPAARGPE